MFTPYNRPRWSRPVTLALLVTMPLWAVPAAAFLCGLSAPRALAVWAREVPDAWRWAVRGEA